MKHYITKKADIGINGPGIYVLDQSKKDNHGKPKRKVITVTDKDKMVEQSQAKLTEVDVLLEPAKKAGLLRHAVKYEGEMDDIPAATYEESLKIVSQANQMFEQLPASFRSEHANDPKQFLQWMENPDNHKIMQKYGMLKGNDGFRYDGTPSGAPTDLNNDGIIDTVDSNADGVPDTNPPAN